MVFQTQELLFFSLNNVLAKTFELYVRITKKEFIEYSTFRLIRDNNKDNKAKIFRHLQELFFFLDQMPLERLANLILVIDPYSLNFDDEETKGLLNELFIRYPEIKIVFFINDEEYENVDAFFNEIQLAPFKCKNIKTKKPCKCCDKSVFEECFINSEIHKFNPFKEIEEIENKKNGNVTKISGFDYLVRGQSNIFDASNIRNAIKQWFYSKIDVNANFPKVQCRRNQHFALSVEEEISQAYFNGYALYAAGYRAMPIVSCLELKNLIDDKKLYDPEHLDLILRDYDLQFEDYENVNFNLNNIRGLYKKDKKIWSFFPEGNNDKNIWRNIKSNYPKVKIYFITRLDNKKTTDDPYIKNSYFRKSKAVECDLGMSLIQRGKAAVIRGITKPINGIFGFHEIKEIRESYNNSLDIEKISTKRGDKSAHSIPPTILHIADCLLNRSKAYYRKRMFLLSALLAKETMEVLNGFHFMMMLQSIYLLTLAETSLVTSNLGIDEDLIAKNTVFRLKQVRKQVERVTQNNVNAQNNVLNQIYNDVRHVCEERELFRAADVALNEMVNVRQGHSICKKLQKLFSKISRLKLVTNYILNKTRFYQ